jgi:hypothetical protein
MAGERRETFPGNEGNRQSDTCYDQSLRVNGNIEMRTFRDIANNRNENMAIEKANKLRNVTNVAKELLKDPTQTEREVAEKL